MAVFPIDFSVDLTDFWLAVEKLSHALGIISEAAEDEMKPVTCRECRALKIADKQFHREDCSLKPREVEAGIELDIGPIAPTITGLTPGTVTVVTVTPMSVSGTEIIGYDFYAAPGSPTPTYVPAKLPARKRTIHSGKVKPKYPIPTLLGTEYSSTGYARLPYGAGDPDPPLTHVRAKDVVSMKAPIIGDIVQVGSGSQIAVMLVRGIHYNHYALGMRTKLTLEGDLVSIQDGYDALALRAADVEIWTAYP